MNDDDAARLLRRRLDAELAGVESTPRSRQDLRAALAAPHRPDGDRPRQGTGRRAVPRSTAAVLLAAAAVALVAAVPTILAERSSAPVIAPLRPAGPPAGVPRPDPSTAPMPTATPPVPLPSPSVSPSEAPAPPVTEPTAQLWRLALDLDAATVRVGVPVGPTITWEPAVAGEQPTPSIRTPIPSPSLESPIPSPSPPPSPMPSPTPAGEDLSIDWGDGTTTSARLTCPQQRGPRAEVPPHTYRTPGTYRLEVTGSGECGMEVAPLVRTVTVTR